MKVRTEFKYQVRQFILIVIVAMVMMYIGGWIDAL